MARKVTLRSPTHTSAPLAAGAWGQGARSWKTPGEVGAGALPESLLLHSIPGLNKENCVCQARAPKSQDRACHAAPWNSCRRSSGPGRRPPRRRGPAPHFPDKSVQHGVERPCDGHGFREEQLVSLPEKSQGVCHPNVSRPEDSRAAGQQIQGTAGLGGSGAHASCRGSEASFSIRPAPMLSPH